MVTMMSTINYDAPATLHKWQSLEGKGLATLQLSGAFKSGAERWLAASNSIWQSQIVRNHYTTSWWGKMRAWVKPFLDPQSLTRSPNVKTSHDDQSCTAPELTGKQWR